MRELASHVRAWPGFVFREIRTKGLRGVKRSITVPARTVGKAVSRRVDQRELVGTPIWERDWDILLVLDACRVDLMKEVCDEYTFLPPEDELDTMWSVASISRDWINRTFSSEYEQEVSRSAYVTGNCFTDKVEFEVEPQILDEVWTYAWDEELSTIPARPLTDRAISTWRERDENIDRMVVHYMQPHVPFVNDPDIGNYGDPEDFGEGFADIWDRVGNDLEYDVVWDAYVDNLRYVLDEVELLIENIDAEVAITADHGNAIGEWGFYGHPTAMVTPEIRCVPWVETSAVDSGSYSPTDYERESDSKDVEERLRSLGYLG